MKPYSFLVKIAFALPLIITKNRGLSSPCLNIISPDLYSLNQSGRVADYSNCYLIQAVYLLKNFNFTRYLSISSNDILLLNVLLLLYNVYSCSSGIVYISYYSAMYLCMSLTSLILSLFLYVSSFSSSSYRVPSFVINGPLKSSSISISSCCCSVSCIICDPEVNLCDYIKFTTWDSIDRTESL